MVSARVWFRKMPAIPCHSLTLPSNTGRVISCRAWALKSRIRRRIMPPWPDAQTCPMSYAKIFWRVPVTPLASDFHDLPPSVVARMAPLPPVTQPRSLSTKSTPNRSTDLPLVRAVQVLPPVVVVKMTPPCPTTTPRVASVKCRPSRIWVLLLVCRAQVVPPSVDFRMLPFQPTTQPTFASTKYTSCRLVSGAGIWTPRHVWPPSVVRRIHSVPTNQPWSRSRKDKPKMLWPAP